MKMPSIVNKAKVSNRRVKLRMDTSTLPILLCCKLLQRNSAGYSIAECNGAGTGFKVVFQFIL